MCPWLHYSHSQMKNHIVYFDFYHPFHDLTDCLMISLTASGFRTNHDSLTIKVKSSTHCEYKDVGFCLEVCNALVSTISYFEKCHLLEGSNLLRFTL